MKLFGKTIDKEYGSQFYFKPGGGVEHRTLELNMGSLEVKKSDGTVFNRWPFIELVDFDGYKNIPAGKVLLAHSKNMFWREGEYTDLEGNDVDKVKVHEAYIANETNNVLKQILLRKKSIATLDKLVIILGVVIIILAIGMIL